MSDSAAQLAGGIVGAAIGFFIGGPLGAKVGFALGSSLVASQQEGPEVEGPRLDDLRAQTSNYGSSIPIPYGTVRLAGTLIWLENNKLREVKRTKKTGGKGGGGGQKQTTYHYYATFAVLLCEGPVRGIKRIWADSKLVFNADSDDPNALLGNALVADPEAADIEFDASTKNGKRKGIRRRVYVYTGTDTQTPHPRIEADRGDAPAWRGHVLLVIEDMELEDFGNRIPSISAEVVEPLGSFTGDVPRLLTHRHFDWSAYNDAGQADLNTDLVHIDNETILVNFNPADTSPKNADGSGAVDHRFGVDLTFLGVAGPAPHPDRANAGHYVGWLGNRAFDVHSSPASDPVVVYVDISHVEPAGGQSLRVFHPDDRAGGDRCGAAISGDHSHLLVTWYIPAQEHHLYELYDVDALVSGVPLRTGIIPYGGADLPFSGRGLEANGNEENHVAALESNTIQLWVVKGDQFGGNATAILYRLDDNDDYVEVGRNTGPSSGSILMAAVADAGLCFVMRGSGDLYTFTSHRRFVDESRALSSIVDDLAARAGVAAADVDSGQLTDLVRGYTVTRPMPVTSALKPLRQAFAWDAVEAGYRIRFVPRGGNVVATLTGEDLGAHEPGRDRPALLTETRELEAALPREIRVNHLDPATDYDPGVQYATRIATDAVEERDVELPLALTADEAAEIADVILREAWAGRTVLTGAVTLQHANLMPTDLVTLQTDDVQLEARIAQVDDGRPGLRKMTFIPDSAVLYVSGATGVGGDAAQQTLAGVGPTALELLDLPALRDTDNDAGFYVAMEGYLAGWRGAELFMSTDGAVYDPLVATVDGAVMGRTTDALPAGPVGIWDRASTVNLQLIADGELSSVTELEVLNGANALAIQAGSGWEVMQFADATLEADGSYTLSTLLRGRRGTDWAVGLHAANDSVVLLALDGSIQRAERTVDTIGLARDYKPVSFDRALEDVLPRAFTYTGVNLKPYSPVHVAGARDGSDNLTITWVRRTRIGGEWRDRVGAPLGEDSEAYEVDVDDGGGTVVRTLASATPSVTYTAADQTTDFGAPQASVTVRVYQISAAVGRGYEREATV